MRNFQDTFETRKRSFISAFPICISVHLNEMYVYLELRHKLSVIYQDVIPDCRQYDQKGNFPKF